MISRVIVRCWGNEAVLRCDCARSIVARCDGYACEDEEGEASSLDEWGNAARGEVSDEVICH
jgi:hypothetical protein